MELLNIYTETSRLKCD